MTNNKWEIKVESHQIADTGDYGDPMYILTNGDIELVTKDEVYTEDPDTEIMLWVLDQYKWEDWKLSDKEYELQLEKTKVEHMRTFLQIIGVPEKMIEKVEHTGSYSGLEVAMTIDKIKRRS